MSPSKINFPQGSMKAATTPKSRGRPKHTYSSASLNLPPQPAASRSQDQSRTSTETPSIIPVSFSDSDSVREPVLMTAEQIYAQRRRQLFYPLLHAPPPAPGAIPRSQLIAPCSLPGITQVSDYLRPIRDQNINSDQYSESEVGLEALPQYFDGLVSPHT